MFNPNPKKSSTKRKVASKSDESTNTLSADDVCSQVEGNKKMKTNYFQGERCVLCTKLVGAENANKSVTKCPTCYVTLCTSVKGSKKTSCWLKWHGVLDLNQLVRHKSVTPSTRSSP